MRIQEPLAVIWHEEQAMMNIIISFILFPALYVAGKECFARIKS
jgi:hypothetical protein